MDFVDYYYFCTVTGICNRTRDQERNETKDQKQFRTTTNESFLFSLSLLLPYSILFPLSLSISTKNSLPSLPIVPFVHEKMRWKNPCTAVRDAWPERRCCSCRFKFSFSVCKLINETLIFLPPRVTSLFSPHVLKNETLYTFFFFFLSENEAMNVHRGLANDGGMEFFRIIWIVENTWASEKEGLQVIVNHRNSFIIDFLAIQSSHDSIPVVTKFIETRTIFR